MNAIETTNPPANTSFGFEYGSRYSEAQTPAAQQQSRPAPRPRQSRSRFVVLIVLVGAVSSGAYYSWDSLFRYEAYGVVKGSVVRVTSPIAANLKYFHVREGALVTPGQRLLSLDSLEIEHQLDRVRDDLQVAEAQLISQVARLRWDAEQSEFSNEVAIKDYWESLTELHKQESELAERHRHLEKTQRLQEANVATIETVELADLRNKQQRRVVESLKLMVQQLNSRVARAKELIAPGVEQLAPTIAKIRALSHELKRIEDRLATRFIEAPVGGTVLRRHLTLGEHVDLHDELVSILESDTLRFELYLPQRMADEYNVGDQLFVTIEPRADAVACEVESFSTEMITAPKQIETRYRSEERLLGVILRPLEPSQEPRVGSVIKLSRKWF